jgi:hypothetical protein
MLLSELRRAEKRTRIRTEWVFSGNTVEKFFDYVPKGTRRLSQELVCQQSHLQVPIGATGGEILNVLGAT